MGPDQPVPSRCPRDLPGEVEGIVHQLGSVNHWNTLKKTERRVSPTRFGLGRVWTETLSHLMAGAQGLQQSLPVGLVVVNSVVASHVMVGQNPLVGGLHFTDSGCRGERMSNVHVGLRSPRTQQLTRLVPQPLSCLHLSVLHPLNGNDPFITVNRRRETLKAWGQLVRGVGGVREVHNVTVNTG